MKILKRILVVLLILALLFAGAMGAYLWYITAHLFVEDAVYKKNAEMIDLRGTGVSLWHVETVRSQLPDCVVYWDVPFQDTTYSCDIQALTLTKLAVEDIDQLTFFENLTTIDAANCPDYAALEVLRASRPDLRVVYQIPIGSTSVETDVTVLMLQEGEYDLEVLKENLIYLPDLKTIHFPKTGLTLEQLDELAALREGLEVTSTVEVLGQEMALDTTELNLSDLASGDVEAVAAELNRLPNLTAVELMKADGTSNLSLADVQTLQKGAPNAVFHYEFEYQGLQLSTTTEEVHIKNKKIGDAGVDELRQVLDIMGGCKRFVLEYSGISNEVLAQLRDEYRGRTKIVWRVNFGKDSTLTDVHIIRATHGLKDSTNKNLIYCEDVRFMDLGHNGEEGSAYLRDITFVTGMPNLEAIILSGSYITDLTPFASCKNLKFLEIAFCGMVTDLSPLAECTSLEMLNIGSIKLTDLSALDELPLKLLMARWYPSGNCPIPVKERERFMELHPDCWASFTGAQPYGDGWRSDEDGKWLPYYAMLRAVFKYDLDPNIPNHTGWYWDQEAYDNSLTEGEK